MLPRIPYCKDFWEFSKAGRALADIHLNYENESPNGFVRLIKTGERNDLFASNLDDLKDDDFKVAKMKFANKKDKSVIIYNGKITLTNIPLKAYEYVVNGKSAIEWIMDRYEIKVDKDSGIKNDPNLFSDDPRYILNLLLKVIEVSVKSVEIINKLPKMDIIQNA